MIWVRSSGLALALALLVTASALADSCPHCGREYGDPAPGDEARIYALRADHEASCPDNPANRPQAPSDDSGSSGYTEEADAGYNDAGTSAGQMTEQNASDAAEEAEAARLAEAGRVAAAKRDDFNKGLQDLGGR